MVLLSEEPHPRWMRRHSRSILYSWMSPRSIVAPQKDRVGKLPNQLPSRYHGLPAVDIADITYSRDMLWGISPGIRGVVRLGRNDLSSCRRFVAKRLVERLERSGFVAVKRAPNYSSAVSWTNS
jgi:hypothetical protein